MTRYIQINCLLLLWGLLPLMGDVIITSKGNKIESISIIKETYLKVHYYFKSQRGSEQTFDQYQVKEIVYDEVPNDFKTAENFFQAGSYSRAIKEYGRTLRGDNWTKQHCLFKIAESYRLLKNYPKAIGAYKKLRKEFPETKYLPESYFYTGECYFIGKKWQSASGNFQKAEKTYREVNKMEKALTALYWNALVYEKAKRFQNALAAYQIVEKNYRKTPEISLLAMARIGHCFLGLNNASMAKNKFIKLALDKDIVDGEVMAYTYLGLGHYHYKEQDYKKALFCYLRVASLYDQDRETSAEAHYLAGNCFQKLANDENDYRARGKRLQELVKRKYPDWDPS